MNMIFKPAFKPELLAPQFPDFSIDVDSIEINANVVSFSLESGCVSIECEVVANTLSETVEVYDQFKPEHGQDVEYTRLEVDVNDAVMVTNKGYADLVDGQKLKLSESQVYELNKQLEYIANDQFKEMAA